MKRDPVLFRPIPDDEGLPPSGGLSMVRLMGYPTDHETPSSACVFGFDFNRDEETPLHSRSDSVTDDVSEP